ncbi:hypothetical protein K7X08_033733 [Anisodus acutangulus]|uniref:Uncharacterized protein n=1 Tax=Anisodus acutangulus TaxID=402998 RepID=A0A9Q1M4Q0_9SOLA|nr:hypothetical protein K7X08_033733 [Anisodus acutangulus]
MVSMRSLACLDVSECPLALEVQILVNRFVRLDLSTSRILACIEVMSSLLDQIQVHQYDDVWLYMIRDKVRSGEANEAMIDSEGILSEWDSILLDQNLEFEEDPMAILDRQVNKLRSKEIASAEASSYR